MRALPPGSSRRALPEREPRGIAGRLQGTFGRGRGGAVPVRGPRRCRLGLELAMPARSGPAAARASWPGRVDAGTLVEAVPQPPVPRPRSRAGEARAPPAGARSGRAGDPLARSLQPSRRGRPGAVRDKPARPPCRSGGDRGSARRPGDGGSAGRDQRDRRFLQGDAVDSDRAAAGGEASRASAAARRPRAGGLPRPSSGPPRD